jgi:GNAT superfamily N-acetyltransferase
LHRVTTENEALSAYALIDGAARSMLSRFGLTHWLYPFKNPDLIKALAMSSTAAVYIARDKESGDDLATVTISSVPLSGWYELSMWQAPAEPAAYIGNLAIDPTRARRGIGRAVLAASARVARATLGASWIRCDAITAHPHLQGFYEGAGWRRRGVAFSVSIKNPLARGATGAPGPPGSPAYVVNAEAPPPDDENVPFACQAYEAMTGDSTAA